MNKEEHRRSGTNGRSDLPRLTQPLVVESNTKPRYSDMRAHGGEGNIVMGDKVCAVISLAEYSPGSAGASQLLFSPFLVISFVPGCEWTERGATPVFEPRAVSHLITWQDGRCSSRFLASLPLPESHLHVATGFGCATIFWILKNRYGQLLFELGTGFPGE